MPNRNPGFCKTPVESTAVATQTPDRDPPQLDFDAGVQTPLRRPSRWSRIRGVMYPSHAHSIFSATFVLMASTFLSRIIGLARVKYIVWLFGRGMEADALNAAFVLPDMISYFLVGGAGSITFVTILTRYHEEGRDAEGERSLSVILTTMYLVLGTAILLAEIVAPWYVRWWFNGFDAHKPALYVTLTRILVPAQVCFFAGGALAPCCWFASNSMCRRWRRSSMVLERSGAACCSSSGSAFLHWPSEP